MTGTIEMLDFKGKIPKNELLIILKREASNIHVYDLMRNSAYLLQQAKYIQPEYRENFINIFINNSINRFKQVEEDKNDYSGYVEGKKLLEFLETLRELGEIQRRDLKILSDEFFLKFSKIAQILAIYPTFIIGTSIHPVGTKFPGHFLVKFENGNYLCPVKSKHLNNPHALCRFCVAKQMNHV